MKAKNMMIKDVYKVDETASVRSVLAFFIDYKISGIPVTNHHNMVVGYISDGDIMRYIGKHKDIFLDSFYTVNYFKGDDLAFDERIKNVLDLNVMTIAKEKLIIVHPETSTEDVAAILGERKIKKLPVVDQEQLVGIISRGDVIRHTFETLL